VAFRHPHSAIRNSPWPAKQRLDELLVARGLAASSLSAGAARSSAPSRSATRTERLDKPGKTTLDIAIEIEPAPRASSPGGEKHAGALAL
jgi:23S rRNA (cytidine1920-2'-O)/16S rRNA (cytidine1409-2'-O)-methyltransferase